MVELGNVREWQGRPVLDVEGAKLGKLEDVYFNVETDEPEFVTVKSGLFGKHLTFVPLEGARASRDNLTVSRLKDEIDNAPSIEPGGELSPDEEAGLFRYYGADYAPAATGSGRRLVRR